MVFEQVENHADHSNGDARIGHVERRPMIAPKVYIHKVDHFLVHDTVDHIADGAAENQNQPVAGQGFFCRSLVKNDQDGNRKFY